MASTTQNKRSAILCVFICVTACVARAASKAAPVSGSKSVRRKGRVDLLHPKLAVDTNAGGFVTCSSVGEGHVLVGFEDAGGQARELVLHSTDKDQLWKRSLKLELSLGVQESIGSCHINPERGLVFATKAVFDTEDSGCGDGKCWKVLYWRYGMDDGGLSVSSGPSEIEGVEGGQYTGFHLDSNGRVLVADHLQGFAVYDLEDPALRLVQNVRYSDAVPDLPSGWDLRPHIGRDLSEQYFAVPMLQFNRLNQSEDMPLILLYEQAGGTLAFRQLLYLSDFVADELPLGAYHDYLTVGIDRHAEDTIMVGLVRTPRTEDSAGANMSKVFTLQRCGRKWIPRDSGLTLIDSLLYQSNDRAALAGALSCDRGRCLICSPELSPLPTCHLYARNDDDSWHILATLGSVSQSFGVSLRGSTAVVRGRGFVRVYAAP